MNKDMLAEIKKGLAECDHAGYFDMCPVETWLGSLIEEVEKLKCEVEDIVAVLVDVSNAPDDGNGWFINADLMDRVNKILKPSDKLII